ncbi:MAG: hypothetical protein D6758_01680 [Gammaproteobacteria bacterium]|nr:MAG: hypothetical protein D6758_01680 [Gammaproteobacteria bacterium]
MNPVIHKWSVLVVSVCLACPVGAHELWIQASRADELDDAAPFPPLEQNGIGGGVGLDLTNDWSLSGSLATNDSDTDEWRLSLVYSPGKWSMSVSASGLTEANSRTLQSGQTVAQLDQSRDEHSVRVALSGFWEKGDHFADVGISLARTESDSQRTGAVWRNHPTLGRIVLQAGRETAQFEDWTLDLDVTGGTWWYGEAWALSPYVGGGWSIGLSEQAEGETVGLRRLSLRSVWSGRAQSAFVSTPDTGYVLAGMTFYWGVHWNLDLSHSITVGGDDDQPVTTLTLGYSWGPQDDAG